MKFTILKSCLKNGKWILCLMFYLQDVNGIYLENTSYIYNDVICPTLLELNIKSNLSKDLLGKYYMD